MKRYLVTTTSQKRQVHWQRLFGLDALPIRQAAPSVESHPCKPTPVLAYTLDVEALHPMARCRFAHYVASIYGLSYDEAMIEITGWPIAATADCRVMVDLSKKGERPLPGLLCRRSVRRRWAVGHTSRYGLRTAVGDWAA